MAYLEDRVDILEKGKARLEQRILWLENQIKNSQPSIVNNDEFAEFLDARNLAKFLGIGNNKAYELLNTKGFPSLKLGKKIMAPKSEVMAWQQRETRKRMMG